MTTDVLIVGGGPAGLAAAIALRQRGATVTVADAMKPPIDKACGEGLMPDSLQELARLGVTLDTERGAAFRGIRFVERDTAATAHFPAGAGSGVGLRRQALHARLAARAEEAGAVLRWHALVQLQDDGGVLVAGEAMPYSWLIGADGQGSQVRRWAGLERGTTISRRYGFRRHFQVEPCSPFVEVHWAGSGQAYITPTGPREVCVAAVVRNPHCRLDSLLAEMPGLRKKLEPAGSDMPLDQERGALTTTRRFACVARGRVALVGDASGSADAITGEGMGMAFRQALLLADCLESSDLGRYNRLHPQILRLPQTMARVMLRMDRYEGFRHRALKMLAGDPMLFTRMLGVHLGSESPMRFLAAKGLELAWKLATPYAAESPIRTPA